MSTSASTANIDLIDELSDLRTRFIHPIIKVTGFESYPAQSKDAIHNARTESLDSKLSRTSTRVQKAHEELLEFESRGGNFVVAPSWDTVLADTSFELHIRPDDYVIPVCHEGMNRSQVMHLAAKIVKSCEMFPTDAVDGAYGVSVPHGVYGGFDPYQCFADITEANWTEYIHTSIAPLARARDTGDWQHEAFHAAFGVEKAPRVGQDVCEMRGRKLNPDESDPDFAKLAIDRSAQRRNMDSLLFRPSSTKMLCGPTGRVVILAFWDAASIFVKRMLEVAGTEDFSNIVIVCLPFPDTIARAGGVSELTAHRDATGESMTRDEMARRRHIEVLGTYVKMLRLVVQRVRV